MVSLKKRQRADAEIPTSSMSDISFLLLLFFLVTTTIDVDTGIGMVLPEYIEEKDKVEIPISKDRLVAVLVNENGDVLMDGKQIAIPQIARTLKPRIESKIDLPTSKKLVVSVKTDRKTNYNLYIRTLDQINLAYQEVRDEYSTGKYGKKYSELETEIQKDVRDKVYKTISIAEPEQVK